MNQEELAARLNVSKGTIGNYESQKREPDFEMLESIADLFNVSLDYLLGHTNERPEYSLEEQWIIKCYRKANKPVQDGIRQILWAFDEKNNADTDSVSA